MTSRRAMPPPQPTTRSAQIVECGNGRLIVSRLTEPIGELTVCLELHETLSVGENARYQSTVSFMLLTDQETRQLGTALELV